MIRITENDNVIDVTEKVMVDDPTLSHDVAQNRALALVQARKAALAASGAPGPVRRLHDGPPVVAIDPGDSIIGIMDRVRAANPYAGEAEIGARALALSAARTAALTPAEGSTILAERDAILAADPSLDHARAMQIVARNREDKRFAADREITRKTLKRAPTTGPNEIAGLLQCSRERASELIRLVDGRA